jgi:phosphatidylinositol glycan class K
MVINSFVQFDAYDFNHIRSHAGVRKDLFRRDPSQVLLTDFFGGVSQVDVVEPEEFVEAKLSAGIAQARSSENHNSGHIVSNYLGGGYEDAARKAYNHLGLYHTFSISWRAWASMALLVGSALVSRVLMR